MSAADAELFERLRKLEARVAHLAELADVTAVPAVIQLPAPVCCYFCGGRRQDPTTATAIPCPVCRGEGVLPLPKVEITVHHVHEGPR
jgi:hypothetical protein